MKLKDIKNPILYERITDGNYFGRSMNDVLNIIGDTNADLIFRSFWNWLPPFNKCSDVPPELVPHYRYPCEKSGLSYEHLQQAISQIKQRHPKIIICGAIPAQRINKVEYDPINNIIIPPSVTATMALDPTTLGVRSITKEQLQEKMHSMTGSGAYFPDVTNTDVQQLFLSWASRQIQCGCDMIWIDMLTSQAGIFVRLNELTAAKQSFDACSFVIDEIHNMGGKVGTWVVRQSLFPTSTFGTLDLDFVTETLSNDEIKTGMFDDDKWNTVISYSRGKPVFAFIDWAGDGTPLWTFSQQLTPAQQRSLLFKATNYFSSKGIKFIQPVHGGTMGSEQVTRPSFGKFKVYDALAPEFNTYPTILSLSKPIKNASLQYAFGAIIGLGALGYMFYRLTR